MSPLYTGSHDRRTRCVVLGNTCVDCNGNNIIVVDTQVHWLSYIAVKVRS